MLFTCVLQDTVRHESMLTHVHSLCTCDGSISVMIQAGEQMLVLRSKTRAFHHAPNQGKTATLRRHRIATIWVRRNHCLPPAGHKSCAACCLPVHRCAKLCVCTCVANLHSPGVKNDSLIPTWKSLDNLMTSFNIIHILMKTHTKLQKAIRYWLGLAIAGVLALFVSVNLVFEPAHWCGNHVLEEGESCDRGSDTQITGLCVFQVD